MNGVHDMGGMQGMGPIEVEKNEPVFHDEWERRMFGVNLMLLAQGHVNFDEGRHAIERMGAAEYLKTTYYEHWMTSLQTLMVEKGILTTEEIKERMGALKEAGD